MTITKEFKTVWEQARLEIEDLDGVSAADWNGKVLNLWAGTVLGALTEPVKAGRPGPVIDALLTLGLLEEVSDGSSMVEVTSQCWVEVDNFHYRWLGSARANEMAAKALQLSLFGEQKRDSDLRDVLQSRSATLVVAGKRRNAFVEYALGY